MGCCELKIINILTLIIIISLPMVSGLGVAPASIKITEDTTFQFKIFNNENLDLEIFFEIQGDDFIELEYDTYIFRQNEKDKIFTAKIKNKEYEISQRANIIVKEKRLGSSQINVNLGVYLPIEYMIFEKEAFLESTINTPLRANQGKGPYVVKINNIGLKDAVGNIQLVVEDKKLEESFYIKGKESKQILLSFNEQFPKGEYNAKLFVNYNNKSQNSTTTFYSGMPHLNVTQIKLNSYSNNILSFDLDVENDWPTKVEGVNIIAKASDVEYESQTFSIHTNETINLFIEAKEQEFILYLSMLNQKPQEYNIVISEGIVYIDGVAQMLNQSNPLNFMFIIIASILLLLFILYESQFIRKNFLSKTKK